MTSHARISTVVVALLLLLVVAPAALAAEPADVAQEIRDDGVFVESGSDLSEADAGELVAAVRNQGERFSIVVLADDPGSGAVVFGDAVVDRLGGLAGLIFVLTPDDLAVVGSGEVYTLDEIDDALDEAIDAGGSDTAYATNFVEALTGTDVALAPEPSEPVTSTDSGGGGGFGFIGFIVIVGGALVLIFWLVRRSKRNEDLRTENQLAAARAEIQEQIDAVANDLLDMEDEVRSANNDRVDDLYNAAGEAYQEASDTLAKADSPREFLDIANDLEVAIWQLDSAEALLDGKQPPPKPTPERLEPAAVPGPEPAGGTGGGPLGVPPRPTYPKGEYARRPTRRSSGMSPNLIEMLITLGAGALAGRSRGPAPAPRARTTPTRRSRPSRRSGGGFLPSPSRKGSSSSRPSRSSRSSRSSGRSSRRGTGGRIRTGRKRRK
ncbi:MAG: hypothetical protein QNJ88_08310 [Acidimicrobiia bacterium]|nr:hypothetical protein [Acidimicrobiia bacterium]